MKNSTMKNITIYSFFLLSLSLFLGCEKTGNYPGGEISPYIAIYDIRAMYKGTDVTLTKENMLGSSKIAAMVISDFTGGNMPEGFLIVQDKRRLNELRGIAIPLGADAATYTSGDSVIIEMVGKVLTRENGMMQIKGVTKADIKKVSSNNVINSTRVPAHLIIANPGKYESTLGVIVKGGFDPLPGPGDKFSGVKTLNDGFANISLVTDTDAEFAETVLPIMANYYGIVYTKTTPKSDSLGVDFRLRKSTDVKILSAVVEIPPVIISGIMTDVKGADGNYEYVQFMATKDINFALTPFSMVATTNPNAAIPTGYPENGWATGGQRTYKINITTGTVAKGTFFYVGGAGRMINGPTSTAIPATKWIRGLNYTTTDGDGFGLKTGGLFANSGNATGVAIFEGINVTVNSKPVDAMFVSSGGSLYTPTPTPQGYKIPNSDWYDIKNPITLEDQPYYRAGTNTMFLPYLTSDQGYFYLLGGEYSLPLAKWTKARTQAYITLTKSSTLEEIEGAGALILKQ